MISIYSRNNRLRADLSETPDGVAVRLNRFVAVVEQRGVDISSLDPAELPPIQWRQIKYAMIDAPFHVVADRVERLLWNERDNSNWYAEHCEGYS